MSRLLPKFTVLNRPWRVAGRPGMAASVHLTNSQSEVAKSNFKAVIFDMGGVLIPSPFEIFRGKFSERERDSVYVHVDVCGGNLRRCISNSTSSSVCKYGCDCDQYLSNKWQPSSIQIHSVISLGK